MEYTKIAPFVLVTGRIHDFTLILKKIYFSEPAIRAGKVKPRI